MSTHARFDHEEQSALHEAFLAGRELLCPSCGGPLDRRDVPPRPDVSYVRDRVWVTCPRCRRSAVLDRRQPR